MSAKWEVAWREQKRATQRGNSLRNRVREAAVRRWGWGSEVRVPQLRRTSAGGARRRPPWRTRRVPEPNVASGSLGDAAKRGSRSPGPQAPQPSRAPGWDRKPQSPLAAAGPWPLRLPPPALTEVVHGRSVDAGPRLTVALVDRPGAAPLRPATFPPPASARNGTRCRAAAATAAAARTRGGLATPPRARWPRPAADPEHAQSHRGRPMGVVVAPPCG